LKLEYDSTLTGTLVPSQVSLPLRNSSRCSQSCSLS